eukprot:scaffold88891_cov55-Phaeocystis_antarctica.AAC.12
MVAQDQVGEPRIPPLQKPGWRRSDQYTAHSVRCQSRTHSSGQRACELAACRAKHRQSMRSRRSPRRPARTPAPNLGSYR